MIGQTLSHYRIVEKIGAGGMGEVYKAHDEHLGRDVAIKVLPTGTLADEHARRRFRKEAEALSKLNHPNIATVFDFDTQEDVDFIVMELVGGTTLAEKVKTGPLAEKEVTGLGAQIADALEEAHERGIIHRDLKPGNIAVTPKGRVKVLDFGLARMLKPMSDEATTEALTQEHAVAGTLPYMSPEELRGEKADHRSDLFSFGVVLYEMTTGRRPFEHTLSTALADAIIHKSPEPPSFHNRRILPGLEAIIIKALDKEPEHRYQSAREMRVDLERLSAPVSVAAPKRKPHHARRWLWVAACSVAVVSTVLLLNIGGLRDRLIGEPGLRIDSIAVLPLENLSGDPEQEYFSDGMTDALIAELGKVSALRVISRRSVMRYKGTNESLTEVAGKLNVDALVEGSVLRSGDRVRIVAQLFRPAPERQLWAESYERDVRDVLSLQNEVASAIAHQIQAELTSPEEARLSKLRTVNADAYDAYLRGRFFLEKESLGEFQSAIEYFNKAIEIDPGFAPAYAGLADVYALFGVFFVLPPQEAFSRSKATAEKALELDYTLAEAHTSLGMAKWNGYWDWSGAEESFLQAIELNDGYAPAHERYGRLLGLMGRTEEGISELKKALELDPVSVSANGALSIGLYLAGQNDQSIEQFNRTLELHPSHAMYYHLRAWPYWEKSMHEEAIATVQEAIKLGGRQHRFLLNLAYSHILAGQRTEALEIIGELKQLQQQTYVDPGLIGVIYASLGDLDEAMAWLENAYEEHSPSLVWVKAPFFDPLRSDPRFQDLLRRMNFPE